MDRLRNWLLALTPLVLLGGVLAAILALEPARLMEGIPPVEEIEFTRVTLDAGGITATVVNDGPDPVTIAQVMVDEAFWRFEQTPPGPLGHLETARLRIPYPWVEGETHRIKVVTSTGLTFEHEIPVAVATPRPSGRLWALFALIGVYVGVIPVAIGLLWYPLVRRLGRRGRDFVLALTVGLLGFLLVDTAEEGLEAAAGLPDSLHGTILFVLVATLAALGIEAFGRRLAAGRAAADTAWASALLVAVGIGLHNLGEGLAIGGAYALGEAALGTLLILGFALHNTTEGLAIVAPLAQRRTALGRLVGLGLIAGVPTIFGAWMGGFAVHLLLPPVFLGIGAGAIAQVIVQILRGMAADRRWEQMLVSPAVVGGLAAGFVVMYLTGLWTG